MNVDFPVCPDCGNRCDYGHKFDCKLVAAVSEEASFDQVWLFVDGASDLSYCGLYVRELAERIGFSQMHVSRLLRKSIEQMRDALAGDVRGVTS